MAKVPQLRARPKTPKTPIGQRIRQLREGARLSQGELSRKTGLSRNTVGRIERNEQNTSLLTLERIADVIGCTVKQFFCVESVNYSSPDHQRLHDDLQRWIERSTHDFEIAKAVITAHL